MEQVSAYTDSLKEIWNFKILTLSEGVVTLGSIVIGLMALLFGVLLSKILSSKAAGALDRQFNLEKSSRYLIETLVFYLLSIFALIFALKFAHIPLTVFTVIGGAVAIGVGFGSQNLVNNFLSGIILMIERPIKVGDFVELDSVYGEVEEIGMRSTGIITYGNKHMVVPNSSFLEKNVINWTRKNKLIRIFIKLGVVYGTDTDRVEELMTEAVLSEQSVLKTPQHKPEVFFTNFGDDALEFQIDFWITLKDLNDRRRVESRIRFKINKLFNEHGLVIAFPQRDVHLFSERPIKVEVTH